MYPMRFLMVVLLALAGTTVADEKPSVARQDWRDLGTYDPAEHGPPGILAVGVPNGPAFSVDTESGHLEVMHGSKLVNPKRLELPVKGVQCVALSSDAKTLYVGSRSDWAVWAFPLARNGMPMKGGRFGKLAIPRGVDRLPVTALTTDKSGRIYAATSEGIQVFDREARLVELLAVPAKGEIFSLLWRGEKRNLLTVHGDFKGGSVFERHLNATGTE